MEMEAVGDASIGSPVQDFIAAQVAISIVVASVPSVCVIVVDIVVSIISTGVDE
jgi:hypothetical protein